MTNLKAESQPRCAWSVPTEDLRDYHDREWGMPVVDDRHLFEKLSLEGFQAGLSWRTILLKREHFRTAFHHFDFDRVAEFGAADVERLLQNEGIVRHRGKIEAVVHNARMARELVAREGSLAAFVWSFEPDPKNLAAPQTVTTCPEAIALGKEFKKRGWKFLGPTTVYAFMQSMGLLNDHTDNCFMRATVDEARAALKRPRLSAQAGSPPA